MTEQSSQLDHNNKKGILLVAGYWENESIDELSQALACKVSLLEPDPTQYALKTRKKMDANWTIHNWTLGNNNGLTKFYLFKPARLSSTMKPKGLARIYRNCIAKELDGVETKTLSGCCENLNITNERPNGLLLGMNASLDFILSGETTEQALKNFSLIRVRIANKGLYDTETKVASVIDSLQSQNFKLVKKFSPDVLFSEYIFEQDLQAALLEKQNAIIAAKETENAILNAELEKWKAKCREQEVTIKENNELNLISKSENESDTQIWRQLENTFKTNISELEENKRQNLDLIKTLEVEKLELINNQELLSSEKQQLINEREEIKKTYEQKYQELSIQIEKLTESLNQAETEKSEKPKLEVEFKDLKSDLIRLESERAELVEDNRQLSQRIEEQKRELESELKALKGELDKKVKERDEQKYWHEENKKWAESLKVKCEELESLNTERQRSTDLAIKLQTKAQIELDDLREKFQSKHHNELKLVELIKELRQKLQQAAEFYHFLQDNHPEIANIEFTNINENMSNKLSKSKRDRDS